MRVTEGTMASMSLTSLQRIHGRLLELQEQVSSQVRITNPGDDPLTAQQILDLQGEYKDYDQYAKNITTGKSFLSIEDGALSSMGDSLTRAKELTVEMANGTYNAQQRKDAALEVDQIKSQMISLANTQSVGRYLFAGLKNNVQPFDANGNYVNPGDDSLISININKTNKVAINYPGELFLKSAGGGTDVFNTLQTLSDDLNANNVAGIKNALSGLGSSLDQIVSARTEIGARMNRFDAAANFNENTQIYLQKAISGKQDIDFTKAMSDLTQQKTAYEAALAATAKISQISLLDYLT